jgi:transcriptional regulator with XRE-family HTH domain
VAQKEEDIASFARALADTIRERREHLGMSLTQLGAHSGLSQQSVSYLERLKRLPNIETLLRVSWTLDIALSKLIMQAEKKAALRRSP